MSHYKHFIRLVEGLTESSAKFRLHPALDPQKYQITDSMNRIRQWRAYTYLDNNAGKGKGKMDEIGYVMVSLTDNTIIPISRGDEHNMGRDLLYHLSRKLPILGKDYVPVWSYGNNYVYSADELPKWHIVLTKWLQYGGPDGLLKGSSDLRGTMLLSSDLVARKGSVSVSPGSLAPVGQKLYMGLVRLSQTILGLQQNPDRIKARAAFVEAARLGKMIHSMSFELQVPGENAIKEFPQRLKELQKLNDLPGLEGLVFGFSGLKNIIHTAMKRINEQAKAGDRMAIYWLSDLRGIWGDVDLAIDMLGRI